MITHSRFVSAHHNLKTWQIPKRAFLIASIFLMNFLWAHGQNSPAVVTVHSAVVAPNPVPFGFNVSPLTQHNITDNHWIDDGGFAPVESRRAFMAESGTTNSLVDVSLWGGTEIGDDVISGYFNGANAYTYRWGADATPTGTWSLVRTDTVSAYTAGPSTSTADHTITFTNNPSAPAIQAGDVVWLNLPPASNLNFADLSAHAAANAFYTWLVFGSVTGASTGSTLAFTRIQDGPPNDNAGTPGQSIPSCLSISSSTNEAVTLTQFSQASVGTGSDYFENGHGYTVDFWMKEPSLATGATGTVTFQITPNLGSYTFSNVTNAWQHFCHTFPSITSDGVTVIPSFQFQFQGPAQADITNVQFYDAARAPDSLDSRVLAEWQNFKPGTMRIWSGFSSYSYTSLDSWLTSELKGRNTAAFAVGGFANNTLEHLPTSLAYCKQIGAQPWLICNMGWTQQEWSNLVDYLAGPSTTTYGAMRPASHPNPYTDDFDTIYLEFGNEEWGTQSVPVQAHYGAYAKLMLAAAKANPHFNSKLKFIVNGFAGNITFTTDAAQVTDASVLDYNTYLEPDTTLTGTAYFQHDLLSLPALYQGRIADWLSLQKSMSSTHPYTIGTYEGGPGTDDVHNTSVADDSLAAAVASLDIFLYGSQSGFGPQNFFLYNLGVAPFTSHTNFENSFRPHPVWEALGMRNQYCNGPMTYTEMDVNPTTTDGNDYPLIGSYCFHDPAGNAEIWVLSRDAVNSTPVTLHLPANPTGTATLYSLTGGAGGAAATNDSAMNVPVVCQTISSFTRNYTFTIPPSSAYLFVVPTGAWPAAGPQVLTSISAPSEVFLSWQPLAGATTYNVYRGTNPGAESSYQTGLTGTSFADTNATGGTAYYYRVSAVIAGTETDYSNEVQGTEGPNVSDPNFSAIFVGNGGYEYNPTGTPWTFTGYSGIQGNGSAWNAAAAPTGTQTAFLQEYHGGEATISQTIEFPMEGTYSISLLAAARQGFGGNPFNVTVDGTLVSTFSPTSTSYTSFVTNGFVIDTPGNHVVSLVGIGTQTQGVDLGDFIDSVKVTSLPVADGDFETPSFSQVLYGSNVTGTPWTFSGCSGIQIPGSWMTSTPAPSGTQAAFLQANGSQSFGQTIVITNPGTYAVKFLAEAWVSDGGQPMNITLDGTNIGSFTPTVTSTYTPFSTGTLTFTSPGFHSLVFSGTMTSGYSTDFIDNVQVVPVP